MNSIIKKAIQKNTKDLLDGYNKGKITIEEIKELEQQAIIDEEYEVAISIREVIKTINQNNL